MELPSSCDVLVVGAGPAGSAAAIMLARAGARVVLVDSRHFPRDKVCGDGLIGDSLGALRTLGVREAVLKEAVPVTELRIYPPYGRPVALQGELACVRRERLDAILVDAARAAGATCHFGVTAAGALVEDGRVVGARLRAQSDGTWAGASAPQNDGTWAGASAPARLTEVRAAITLLATGANATALKMFGLDAAMQPAAVAGRAYYEAPADVVQRYRSLMIVYDRDWCPGYGWIFPSPGRQFNIGVGLLVSGTTGERHLREFWQAFITRFEPAREILASGKAVSVFRGAPLRTGMNGGSFGRAGLLAVGDAASLTYAATGEGIGKAMESGIMAASCAVDALAARRSVDDLHMAYERSFKDAFSFRYRAYSVAEKWAANPLILSLLAARTNAGKFARHELEDLIAERGDARVFFSKRGLLRALFQ